MCENKCLGQIVEELRKEWFSVRVAYLTLSKKKRCEKIFFKRVFGHVRLFENSFLVLAPSFLRLEEEYWRSPFFNSRTAIAGAIIGLLLVFFYFVAAILRREIFSL